MSLQDDVVSKFSAKGLVIPVGNFFVARIVDNVRELATYHIESDGVICGWDTVIDGNQYTVKKIDLDCKYLDIVPSGMTYTDNFVMNEREDSRLELVKLYLGKIEVSTEIKPFYKQRLHNDME